MALTRGAVVAASPRDPSDIPRPFLVLRSDRFAANPLVTMRRNQLGKAAKGSAKASAGERRGSVP